VKKRIAFFDFDGTVTTSDTLLEFIKFSKGRLRFCFGFLWNSPYLVAYKIKLISNQTAKEKVLQFFFKSMPAAVFKEQCELFARQVLPGLLRPKAIEQIKKLKNEGCVVVIVSASPENWIQNWSEKNGLELIASQLEIAEGKLTGKIVGKNCHGPEKVRRILKKYVVKDYDEIYAYGDTKGDLPMLELATQRFYKPFN
jgi:phosphatidylglycerophosphatase C